MDHRLDRSRRDFLRASSLAGAAFVAGHASAAEPDSDSELKITQPMDGAVMHRRLGRTVAEGLEIDVHGSAPNGARVLVQGKAATRAGQDFHATAVLKGRETEIVACLSDDAAQSSRVRVLWDQQSQKRYRFVIDDNSFFLRDITQHNYRSLFDCFYLKMLRDLNQKYDACFTLNIYYTTGEDWNLRQFPDKYRDEWKDNAHWLRLAFHAYANDPPRPYQDVPAERLIADVDLVAGEIERFAGLDAYSPPVVIHWGMTRPAAWKALYQRGSRVLGGYFRQNRDGQWDINYRVDDQRSEWLSRHDLLKDFASGIIFSKVDIVVNSTPLAEIVPRLNRVAADPAQGEIIDLLTHEQYFWPFYENYLPDHAQRMDRAVELLTRGGYKPVFLQDGFLGNPV